MIVEWRMNTLKTELRELAWLASIITGANNEQETTMASNEEITVGVHRLRQCLSGYGG